MAEIREILALIDKLDAYQQGVLMRKLKEKEEQTRKLTHTHKLTELRGLGKEFWRSIDVEDYIRTECKW